MWLILLMLAQSSVAPEPWDEPLAPRVAGSFDAIEPSPTLDTRPSLLQTIARGAYRAYVGTIGREKGPTCNFAPSCSLYGHQAIERVGLPLGLLLFGARLLRGHVNFDRFYRFDGVRLLDPLEDTLAWLVGEPEGFRWHWVLRSSSR